MSNISNAAPADNAQKFKNYKDQFHRLDLALKYNFNLEVAFIAYAIIEDRTESVLRHSGNYDAYIKSRRGHGPTIESKIRYIQKISESKKELMHRYFSDDLLDRILAWKEDRNRLIHALMKQNLTTENFQQIAASGTNLAKELRNRVNNYNRALNRKNLEREL